MITLVDPNVPGRYPVCPFLALTGRFCPGCGSVRGLHALLRGDVLTAAGRNLLFVLAVPVVLHAWAAWALPTIGVHAIRPLRWHAPAIWGLLVVVVAFAIVRNLAFGAALAP